MRSFSHFSGLAALLAVAAACQACGPEATPAAPAKTCPAQGFIFDFNDLQALWPVAAPGTAKRPTTPDLSPPPCVVAGKSGCGTACCGQGRCDTAVVCPVNSGGCCCVIKTADGKTTCVPVDARKVVVLKDGSVHVDGLVCTPAHPGKPTVEGSLARLEALKAKQAEIEAEVKKEQAVLKGLLDEIQKRVNKMGVGSPLPPAVPVPPTAPSPPAPPTPGSASLPSPYGPPVPPGSPYLLTPQYGPSASPSPGR